MGLIRELVDEVISLPKQAECTILENNQMVAIWNFGYTFLNLIYQSLDCVVVPYFTFIAFSGNIQNVFLSWIIIILGVPASLFSILQFFYYFLSPIEKYVNPIAGRLFGETAIGAFIACVLKIKIKTFIK